MVLGEPLTPGTREVDLHIVLVEPEIHWNTGNAGRTSLALGAQLHLVGPMGFSLDDKQVRRAGLDYWSRVDPVLWDDWSAFEPEIPRLGEPILFSSEASRSYWEVDYPEHAVLIFGSESVGLSEEIRRRYRERMVAIPIRDGSVRSLNLSTAVALGGFEARRRRAMAST